MVPQQPNRFHLSACLDSSLTKQMSCVCAKLLQLCLTLCNPLDPSPSGSTIYGILQARILEWVAIPSSKGSSRPRDLNLQLLRLLHWQAGFFTTSTSWEALSLPTNHQIIQTSHILPWEHVGIPSLCYYKACFP